MWHRLMGFISYMTANNKRCIVSFTAAEICRNFVDNLHAHKELLNMAVP